MSRRVDSIDIWLAALKERVHEDVHSEVSTLDKDALACKLSALVHQVRGPSDVPYGMQVYRLELRVDRRQNKRYQNGKWIKSTYPKVADFLEVRVVNNQWDVILSMESRMDDSMGMRRLFQFVSTTRMRVLTLQFLPNIYTGKLKTLLLQTLSFQGLERVEIYNRDGASTLPNILLSFLAGVAKNKRKCYWKNLSIHYQGSCHDEDGCDECSISSSNSTASTSPSTNSDSSSSDDCITTNTTTTATTTTPDREEGPTPLSKESAKQIAEMLIHFKLKVLTLDGVCIKDEDAAHCLADGIQRCRSLESLNLTSGRKDMLNDTVQQIIGQSVLHNESLKKLRLSA